MFDWLKRKKQLLLAPDPGFPPVLSTPNGKLELLLLLGIENELRERALAVGTEEVLRELRVQNAELVTRLDSQLAR
jgi:hypothetical protein